MNDGTPIRYRSKMDAWIAIIFVVALVIPARIAWAASRGDEGMLAVPLTALLVTAAVILWLVLDTSYTITATHLVIRGGPVRSRVLLSSIKRVRRSHTLIAAPALSLRRLEIDYGRGDLAVVSPSDQDGFLATLHARVPAIDLPPSPATPLQA